MTIKKKNKVYNNQIISAEILEIQRCRNLLLTKQGGTQLGQCFPSPTVHNNLSYRGPPTAREPHCLRDGCPR